MILRSPRNSFNFSSIAAALTFASAPRTFSSSANNATAPFAILFFGSDSFSLPTLAHLVSSPALASHVAVMCPQDAPSGRGLQSQPCAVKQFALQHSLSV
jgi:hypothetical protein